MVLVIIRHHKGAAYHIRVGEPLIGGQLLIGESLDLVLGQGHQIPGIGVLEGS